MAKRKNRKRYQGPDVTTHLDLGVGETLTLDAGEFDERGLAIADYQGAPVTIAGAVPGESVTASIVKVYRDRIATLVESVDAASEHRVTPKCRYFGACSGCQWQHISYDQQLKTKRSLVESALAPYETLNGIQVDETKPSPTQFRYRNHARFTVGRREENGFAGYMNADSRRFVRIDECMIMDDRINATLSQLQGRLQSMTQFSIRVGANTGDTIVQPLLPAEIQDVPSGRQKYVEEVNGAEFQVAASSFFQVNTAQLSAIVEEIVGMLELDGNDVLVDLYCGVGTFARLLSPHVKRVIGIEESASAVEDARFNCSDVANVEFIEAKAEQAAADLSGSGLKIDLAIIDPPRKGCHPEALDALKTLSPRRIMMVSCNPITMARDLDALCQSGFKLVSVRPVDMFPQTKHVESLAQLES
ncbi:MAG: 23S rRNA (uracil(1939)-C(5))-methyltransferase RlmD [Chloroflexi bacterium]|nr:23S rRNA (uracil(1939)-C(5))-methyltransferase RlmD [Chloroflexota bacterium]